MLESAFAWEDHGFVFAELAQGWAVKAESAGQMPQG